MARYDDVHGVETFFLRLVASDEIRHHARLPRVDGAHYRHE